jgi:proteasome accessory factor B
MKALPIHTSQKEVSRSNEKVRFELGVIVTVELKMTLLGMGKEVKVLEPISLVSELKEIIEEMLEGYI